MPSLARSPTRATGCAEARAVAIDLGATMLTAVDDVPVAAAPGRVAAHDLAAMPPPTAGSASRAGELIVRAGDVLDLDRIARLRERGVISILCRRPPTVTVLLVGDRRDPADGVGVAALLRASGAVVAATIPVAEEPDAVVRALSGARADVVVCCGGIAPAGERHVRAALTALMAEEPIGGLTLRPGVPVWIGRLPRVGLGFEEPVSRIVFGLPTDVADALTAVALLVVPALRAMTGQTPSVGESGG